jgi:hypothetical protein
MKNRKSSRSTARESASPRAIRHGIGYAHGVGHFRLDKLTFVSCFLAGYVTRPK